MALTRAQWILFLFNALYILGFAIYYLSIQSYEFLWYIAVMIFFFGLIAITLHRSHFTNTILWGLSLWGLLHVMGGGIPVGDSVLYAYRILPLYDGGGDFFILKFDQFVHAFGFGVSTLVVHHLLRPYLNDRTNWKVVYPLIIAGAMGLGALNEIVEFIAVLSFSNTGVGGYANTGLDLVFNMIGAIIAIFFIHFQRKKERPAKETVSMA